MGEFKILSMLTIIFVVMLSAMVMGMTTGVSVGIAWSDKNGPRAACERLRFPLYDCSQFKEQGE